MYYNTNYSPGYFLCSRKSLLPNSLLLSVFPKKCFIQACYRIQVLLSVCMCMCVRLRVCACACLSDKLFIWAKCALKVPKSNLTKCRICHKSHQFNCCCAPHSLPDMQREQAAHAYRLMKLLISQRHLDIYPGLDESRAMLNWTCLWPTNKQTESA